MGYYRPRDLGRSPAACAPGRGMDHEPEPVTLLDGTTVRHVCRHCLVRLVSVRPPGGSVTWRPYTDEGVPLPTLPRP